MRSDHTSGTRECDPAGVVWILVDHAGKKKRCRLPYRERQKDSGAVVNAGRELVEY